MLDKLVEQISSTESGVYDLSTTARPNVLLELGIAIGLKKPFYITARKGCDIPTDVAGLDRIEYDTFTDLSGSLRELIVKKLDEPT